MVDVAYVELHAGRRLRRRELRRVNDVAVLAAAAEEELGLEVPHAVMREWLTVYRSGVSRETYERAVRAYCHPVVRGMQCGWCGVRQGPFKNTVVATYASEPSGGTEMRVARYASVALEYPCDVVLDDEELEGIAGWRRSEGITLYDFIQYLQTIDEALGLGIGLKRYFVGNVYHTVNGERIYQNAALKTDDKSEKVAIVFRKHVPAEEVYKVVMGTRLKEVLLCSSCRRQYDDVQMDAGTGTASPEVVEPSASSGSRR